MKCDQMTAKISISMPHSQIVYQTVLLFLKKLFNAMFSSESDEITALWPKEGLTFTFHVTLSSSIQNFL